MSRTGLVGLRGALLVTVVLVSGCSRDPEVAKKEYFDSANRYLEQKNYDAAIIEYRNAVQQDPRFGQARRKLAEAYLHLGDGRNALQEAVRAADLLPDDAEAQLQAG